MNKNTNFNFAKISKEQTNALIATVPETVATDFVTAKKFTIVDLWNIRRRSGGSINIRKSTLM